MIIAFGIAGIGGIYLIWYAGWPIFVIGVVSIIAALGYTNGPIPNASLNLPSWRQALVIDCPIPIVCRPATSSTFSKRSRANPPDTC